MTQHADAVRCLGEWQAPDADQESLRDLYLAHLAAHPDATERECRPDHLTASSLVVSHDLERVLLVHHAKAGLWLQTGGHLESADTALATAALREAREESGIEDLTIDPVPVRLSRHAVPFCGPIQPAHHLDVQFVAMAAVGAEPVLSDESTDIGWFSVDRLPEPTDDDVRELVSASVRRLRGNPGLVRTSGSD